MALLLDTKSKSVADKTIYGWESGQAQPDDDTFLILCEIYHIDNILEAFGYCKSEPLTLTLTEREIISNLRWHPKMLDAVKKLLK